MTQFTVYTVHNTLHAVYIVLCILYCVHCTVYIVLCVYCTVHTVLCILYCILCTIFVLGQGKVKYTPSPEGVPKDEAKGTPEAQLFQASATV